MSSLSQCGNTVSTNAAIDSSVFGSSFLLLIHISANVTRVRNKTRSFQLSLSLSFSPSLTWAALDHVLITFVKKCINITFEINTLFLI